MLAAVLGARGDTRLERGSEEGNRLARSSPGLDEEVPLAAINSVGPVQADEVRQQAEDPLLDTRHIGEIERPARERAQRVRIYLAFERGKWHADLGLLDSLLRERVVRREVDLLKPRPRGREGPEGWKQRGVVEGGEERGSAEMGRGGG